MQAEVRRIMSWDPEQLTEETYALASTTSTNDPRQHPWGAFFWPDAPAACGGGSGHFHWLESLGDALSLVTDYSPAMFMTFEEEREWLELRDKLRTIATGFKDNPNSCLETLNRELSGLLHVDWIGSYQELSESDNPFCQRIRAGFLVNDEDLLNEESTCRIRPEDEQSFCDWLPDYGV